MKLINKLLTRRLLIIANIALILLLGAAGLFGLYKRSVWHENYVETVEAARNDIDNLLRYIVLPDMSKYDTLDDFGKTTLLREWVHGNVSTKVLPGDSSKSYYDYSKGALFYRVLREKAGYFCGGKSFILATIYDLFGYETTDLNMGFPANGNTHVVTLVKIRIEGEERIIVQDAIYDQTILDNNGLPADLGTIFDAARRRDFSGLFFPKREFSSDFYNRIEELFLKYERSADFLNLYWFPMGIGVAWGGMHSEIVDIYESFGRPIKPNGWDEREIDE